MTFDENAWAGATANVYVLKYVLEKNLGCTVNIAKLPESTPLFQAMTDGKVDVVLEDWNNIQLKVNRHFVTKEKSIVNLGSSGVIGHIGWFIPTYLMKQHPEFKTWKGLKGKESLFKSPESGSQGMFLGGDPTYVQKDAQLIKALGLELQVRLRGRRARAGRPVDAAVQAEEADPLLLVTPQYLNTAYQLSEIQLPKRHKNCQDSYSPKLGSDLQQYNCAYAARTIIEKLISTKFAKSGSPAVPVIKRWKWSANDQNFVANLIAGQQEDPVEGGREVGKGQPRQGQGLAREVDPRRGRGDGSRRPARTGTRMATPTLHIHEQRAADARSLSDRAYYAIRELIVTLELPPGSVVSERELMERLELGRTPVREALRDLAREQLVEVYPRRGIFVSGVDVGDIAGLSEVRRVLEGQAARLAAERRNDRRSDRHRGAARRARPDRGTPRRAER